MKWRNNIAHHFVDSKTFWIANALCQWRAKYGINVIDYETKWYDLFIDIIDTLIIKLMMKAR